MAANFTSKLADWQTRHRRAVPTALEAAAVLVEGAVKRKHTPIGYTSRKFATGRVRNSITHSRPVEEGGAWVARVGTNVTYAMFWEMGHQNLFSGRYERVQLWVPAVMESREAAAAKFRAIYEAMMSRGAPA